MAKSEIAWLLERPIAHRGYYDEHLRPENSLAAFRAAIAADFAIKLDVRLTKSGEVLIFNDRDLGRMCGETKLVSNMIHQEHKRYTLKDGQPIPLLTEGLKVISKKVPVLIDIREEKFAPRSCRLILNALMGHEGRLAVVSVNPMVLHWFGWNAPSIFRGQVVSSAERRQISRPRAFFCGKNWFNFLIRPDFIAWDIRDLRVEHLRKKNKRSRIILGWTIDDEEKAFQWHGHLDNVIFERLNAESNALNNYRHSTG